MIVGGLRIWLPAQPGGRSRTLVGTGARRMRPGAPVRRGGEIRQKPRDAPAAGVGVRMPRLRRRRTSARDSLRVGLLREARGHAEQSQHRAHRLRFGPDCVACDSGRVQECVERRHPPGPHVMDASLAMVTMCVLASRHVPALGRPRRCRECDCGSARICGGVYVCGLAGRTAAHMCAMCPPLQGAWRFSLAYWCRGCMSVLASCFESVLAPVLWVWVRAVCLVYGACSHVWCGVGCWQRQALAAACGRDHGRRGKIWIR